MGVRSACREIPAWTGIFNCCSFQFPLSSNDNIELGTIKVILLMSSRLSTGSTKSEMLEREKKHGKGLMKKIATKLTKSASVDDPNVSMDLSLQVTSRDVCVLRTINPILK